MDDITMDLIQLMDNIIGMAQLSIMKLVLNGYYQYSGYPYGYLISGY